MQLAKMLLKLVLRVVHRDQRRTRQFQLSRGFERDRRLPAQERYHLSVGRLAFRNPTEAFAQGREDGLYAPFAGKRHGFSFAYQPAELLGFGADSKCRRGLARLMEG